MNKVEKALRSLNQTRKSLSAEDSYLEQPGQLLDKALAKQIAMKETKPYSLIAPNKSKVSCDCQMFITGPREQKV